MHSPSREPAAGDRIGGWAVVRLLGRGGMATVYEAERAQDGVAERGAIKLVNPGGPSDEVEARFRRELRTLSRLHHPNICAVRDWGVWENRPFFVMELVGGRDLKAEVEAWASVPLEVRWSNARRVLIEVARALDYVHQRGLVHRDITPSNVRVLSDGSAKLMDFGVVKEVGQNELTAHGELLGTVAWIAPEQIGGGRVDARTDLYALGAVLYFMLTGRRPFNARTLAGYLDKHLHRPPRPPREFVPGIPHELEEVCLRLMQKEPMDRYASASHLLHALEGAENVADTLDPREWPVNPVGRSEERAAIVGAVTACQDGHGAVLLVEGGPGMGKTRMARLAAEAGDRAGLTSALTRASLRRRPLEPWAQLYDALTRSGVAAPAEVGTLFGATGGTAVRTVAFAAFREMILSSPARVVVVDDLHLADAASIELAEFLVRTTVSLAGRPFAWIFTSLPDAAALHGLATGATTELAPTRITLGPLDVAAVEELLLTILPDDGVARVLARRLAREGEGNPSFIGEMVRSLVEDKVITRGEGERHLVLDVADIARLSLPIPRSLREQLTARLARLGENAETLLAVLAVARQEMTVPLLCDVTMLDDASALAGMDELIDAGLVRERRVESDEHFDLPQARVRDFVYGAMEHEERVQIHRRIGETLERVGRRRMHLVVEAVATHFEQGEVPGKAYPYLIRAGQRLLDRSFFREADGMFERAVAIEPDARENITLDDADRLLCDVLLKRYEALDHLGRGGECVGDLDRARALATELDDARLMSRALTSIGQQARQRGDLDAAEAMLVEALTLAERAGDAGLRASIVITIAGIRWGHGDIEAARRHYIEALALGDSVRDEKCLAFGYNGLGLVALGKGQSAEARKHFEQSAGVFERIGLLAPLSAARMNLCEVHHCTGNLRRGLELAERTWTDAREAHHLLGMVRGRRQMALLLTDLGRNAEAMDEGEGALTIARRLGDPSVTLFVLVALIRAIWAAADDQARVESGLAEAESLAGRHDADGFGPVLHAWRARWHATQGDVAGAEAAIQRALATQGPRWPYQECRTDIVLAQAFAEIDNPAEATRRAEAAVRRADACGYRFFALKGHCIAAQQSRDEAAVARHRRVADALARSLAANLPREDAERFLGLSWLSPALE